MASSTEPSGEQWKACFNKAAVDYERQSAGVTRKIAKQLLPLLPPITSSSAIHDNACGPGIVTQQILIEAAKSGATPKVEATDFSEGMINAMKAWIEEKNIVDVNAQVMDGSDLSKFEDNTFTHSITNFGIFAFPDPVAGVAHIKRTLKPGGVGIITSWKYPGNIFFANEVLEAINPGGPEWFPLKDWLEEGKLEGILEKAGFAKDNIEVTVKKAVWEIDDIDDTVTLFGGPFWEAAKATLVNDEQKGKWAKTVKEKLVERNGKGIDMIATVAVVKK